MKGKPIEIDCRECANCTGHSCKKFGDDAAEAVKKCANTAFRSYRKREQEENCKDLSADDRAHLRECRMFHYGLGIGGEYES